MKNSLKILLWSIVLTAFSFGLFALLSRLVDDPISRELQKSNPDIDGQQLFPAFMMSIIVISALIIPWINYILMTIVSLRFEAIGLVRRGRIFVGAILPALLILFLYLAITVFSSLSIRSDYVLQDLGGAILFAIVPTGAVLLYTGFVALVVELIAHLITKRRK